MEINELVEKYSADILNESDQNKQNEAMINVVTIISNEMGQKLESANIDSLKRKEKKAVLERILQETNDKYTAFVLEINKMAGKDLLKPDGIRKMLAKNLKL